MYTTLFIKPRHLIKSPSDSQNNKIRWTFTVNLVCLLLLAIILFLIQNVTIKSITEEEFTNQNVIECLA